MDSFRYVLTLVRTEPYGTFFGDCYARVNSYVRDCLRSYEKDPKLTKLIEYTGDIRTDATMIAFMKEENPTDFTEKTVVIKAVKQKLASKFMSEFKKRAGDYKNNTTVKQSYLEKKRNDKKKEKHFALIQNVDNNTEFTEGITAFCVWLCEIGLSNFTAFSSCFLYVKDLTQTSVTYTAKLIKDKKDGVKKIVFVKN